MSLSREAVACAVERNLVYVFGQFARALPDAEFSESPDLFWMLTPLAVPVFNTLLAARLDRSTVDGAIEAAKGRAAYKRLPLLWWVFAQDTPSDLGARLAAAGFAHVEGAPCLSLDLASPVPGVTVGGVGNDATEVDIRTIASESDARDWCEVLRAGSGLPPAFGEGYLPFARSVAALPHGPLRNYGLWWKGELVGTSSLAFDDGVGGIYNVATLAFARRRGFGTALTAHAAGEARKLGASIAILQLSQAGFGVY